MVTSCVYGTERWARVRRHRHRHSPLHRPPHESIGSHRGRGHAEGSALTRQQPINHQFQRDPIRRTSTYQPHEDPDHANCPRSRPPCSPCSCAHDCDHHGPDCDRVVLDLQDCPCLQPSLLDDDNHRRCRPCSRYRTRRERPPSRATMTRVGHSHLSLLSVLVHDPMQPT